MWRKGGWVTSQGDQLGHRFPTLGNQDLPATFHLREWDDYEAKLVQAKQQGFRLVRLFPTHQGWSLGCEQLRLVAIAAGQVGLPLMAEVAASGDLTTLARQTAEAGAPVIAAGVNLAFAALVGEAIAVARTHPHIHLETSRFDAPGMYELAVKEIGAERVIYGSAALVQYMASALGAFREADLSEDDRRLIGGENIKRLVGDLS